MMEKFPQTKYIDDVQYLTSDLENQYAYALFDCIIVDTHYMSEDWTYCHRWREIGGQIWTDVSIEITHSGMEDYKGRLLSSLVIQ